MTEERTPRMSSVLGETAIVIGNVDGTGDLEIRGRVQGSVSLNGRVLVAETGVILGGVEATSIIVAGEVRGDLAADDGVEVQALGRVEGNIEAPRVGIEAGARVRGMMRTGADIPADALEKKPEGRRRSRRSHKKPEPAISVAETPQKGAEHPAPPAPPANEPRPEKNDAEVEKRPKKGRRTKGPPTLPTFVKGARGRLR